MENNKYIYYLRDLIYSFKEQIQELEQEKENDFDTGLKCGYQQVLDRIQNQAEIFEIDLEEIGFNDFEKFKDKK